MLWCLSVASLEAAEGSAREVLGFSPDGLTFAFRQAGVSEGPGYPYADVFIIDTATDGFAAPPVHVSLDKEGTPRSSAVALAMQRAKAALGAARIGAENPAARRVGLVAGSRPGELLGQVETMMGLKNAAQSLALDATALGSGVTITIAQVPLPAGRCKDAIGAGNLVGFALTLERPGKPALLLHKDAALPAGRPCAIRYGLSEAYLYAPPQGPKALAVLLEVYAPGFEGPDRRFLAVTAQLER